MIWKINLPSNESCVLSSEPSTYGELLKAIHEKYDVSSDKPFTLKYKDVEEELINLCSAEDFDTAILSAKKEKLNTLQIFVIPQAQNQISQNNFKSEQLASLINKVYDNMSDPRPFARRNRQSNTYGPSKSQTDTPKNSYKSRLPVINEARILQKGKNALQNFGKRKRTSSCPILEKGKCLYPTNPEKPELNISPQDLKSICLKFLEKFAEEKINNKVKQEIKDVIPVLMELLKEAWHVNAPKTQNLQRVENTEKICCQCNKPAKPVQYICTGCLETAEFAKEVATGGSGRAYNSFDSAKLLQNAKQDSFRLEANRMNNNFFSHNSNLAIRKRNSRRLPDAYKVSLLRVKPDEVQQVKAQESYKVSFELKNCGDVKWPDNVKLVCINGLHKGNEKMLPALDPGRKITVELSLQAPKEDGKYLSQWRVSHGKGRRLKSFGESIFEEIQVTGEKIDGNVSKKEVQKEENVEKERGRQGQEDNRGSENKKSPRLSQDSWSSVSSDVSEAGVPKKIRCQEDRIKCAKFLNEVFPGDLEEKINFIKKFLEEVTIFDVVEKYLVTLGKSNARGDSKKLISQGLFR